MPFCCAKGCSLACICVETADYGRWITWTWVTVHKGCWQVHSWYADDFCTVPNTCLRGCISRKSINVCPHTCTHLDHSPPEINHLPYIDIWQSSHTQIFPRLKISKLWTLLLAYLTDMDCDMHVSSGDVQATTCFTPRHSSHIWWRPKVKPERLSQ